MDDGAVPPPRLFDPLIGQGRVLAVIAAGGALGALVRHGAGVALPHPPGAFPLATFGVNVVGCLLIGVLMTRFAAREPARPLVRPFLTTGVLGGFTTFSTYAIDAEELLRTGRVATAVGYLAGTLALALVATWSGIRLAGALPGGTR